MVRARDRELPADGRAGTVRTLWTALELSRRQAIDLAEILLSVGTDPRQLMEGQEVFNQPRREKPRIR